MPPIKGYEYAILVCDCSSSHKLEAMVNERAAQGFQLESITFQPCDGRSHYVIVMKKDKTY